MTSLIGKVALVTGGGSGIGRAVALALAAEGARVAVAGRRPERLAETVAMIEQAGGTALSVVTDVSDGAQVIEMVVACTRHLGGPDILVNNAGAGRWLPLLETTADEAASMMALPYLAAFNLTRELLPGMLKRGSGRIVNITSVGCRLAWPGAVGYSAARAAMEAFTNSLRADVQGSGIGVMLATFGTVESNYWKNNPGSREHMPQRSADIRVLTQDEVAGAIVRGIERDQREVLEPAIYRLLFPLNALFPTAVSRYVTGR